MSLNFKIGYSAWGFLGSGIVDTPDGGRSHRPVLLQELIKQGIDIIMLQRNRDLTETGTDFTSEHLRFEDINFPEVDLLFLEYRWPIPGRNVEVDKDTSLYTPDFDRQQALIRHYGTLGKPIFIWDKDQQLTQDYVDQLGIKNLQVFEPALQPKRGRKSLLFPMDMSRVQELRRDIASYRKSSKEIDLVYIGNQYDRNETFLKYYDQTSKILRIPAEIYGKWTEQGAFRNVNFNGRIGYDRVQSIYEKSFVNILIAPERYYKNGQYTQRIFESLWGLCLPLVPREYAYGRLYPEELIVGSSKEAAKEIERLKGLSDQQIVNLFDTIVENLSIFSVEKQARVIIEAFLEYREL